MKLSLFTIIPYFTAASFNNHLLQLKSQFSFVEYQVCPNFKERNVLHQDAKYFFYLPYEGFFNQQLQLIRAFLLCRYSGRTLIIPPIIPSKHDTLSSRPAEWHNYFDLSSIDVQHLSFTSILNFPMFLDCFTFDRFPSIESLGYTTRSFLSMFSISCDLNKNIEGRAPDLAQLELLLEQKDQIVCISNLQHIKPLKEENKMLQSLDFSYHIYLQYPSRQTIYNAVHYRRGDFADACKKGKKIFEDCYWNMSKVNEIATNSSFPLYIGTNEKDVQVLKQLSDFGTLLQWDNSDHFMNVIFDAITMIFAETFHGNQYSTMSKYIWHRRRNIYSHKL